MRETEKIERYLSGQLNPEDKLLMDARMLIDPELNEKSHWQKITYRLVKSLGRKQLKNEIAQTENRLFTEPEFARFQQKIHSIFN